MDEHQPLLARIAAMEAELAELKARVEAEDREAPTAGQRPAPAPVTAGEPADDEAPDGASRRALLGGAAAGAAGVLAGIFLGSEPAAATVGAMQYGASNDAGGANTELKTSSATPVLTVTQRTTGAGVYATSAQGSAVEGRATSGAGVWGYGSTGTGVRAVTTLGRALLATAGDGVGIESQSDQVQLRLSPSAGRGAPTSDSFAHKVGDLVRDDAGDLWYCTVAGTPGTWRKVSGPSASGAVHLLAAPVRIFDSRPGTLPSVGNKTAFDGGEVRTLDCRVNGSGVPSGAVGVILTCMVVNAVAGSGNFTVWASSKPKPAANTMVWGGTSGRASTLALSAVGTSATINVSSSIACDIVVDVVGYFR